MLANILLSCIAILKSSTEVFCRYTIDIHQCVQLRLETQSSCIPMFTNQLGPFDMVGGLCIAAHRNRSYMPHIYTWWGWGGSVGCPGGWVTILEVNMLVWGRLDVLPNSLKHLCRWLMVANMVTLPLTVQFPMKILCTYFSNYNYW